MSEALDLGPIKARLAATTPGEWKWADEIGDIPYEEAWRAAAICGPSPLQAVAWGQHPNYAALTQQGLKC